MLALIAAAGARGITRDRLISILWTDTPEESARRSLATALHALRKELDDALFQGVQELRLNLAVCRCDVVEFEAALTAQDLERAATCYGGPFLDGFRVPGAGEFDRWMEEERSRLERVYRGVLERLGRRALDGGQATVAVQWYRKLATLDPLNARVAVDLMRALAAAGERHAALQHARIYEALVEQELSVEPDRQVLELAEVIRREPVTASASAAAADTALASSGPVAASLPDEPSATERIAAPTVSAVAPPPSPLTVFSRRWGRVIAAGVVLLLILGLGAVWRRTPDGAKGPPILAVGLISDHRGDAVQVADAVADMLATNLARVPGLPVLSSTRVLELLQAVPPTDHARAAWAEAARHGGAGELLEGSLFQLSPERLLLDLRRVDLRTGEVRTAFRTEGKDIFEAVARATADIAASFGRSSGPLDPGDVSTRSLVAYRFYEEGLHALARGQGRGAEQLFAAALREDSSFAMAAYYRWLARLAYGGWISHEELQHIRELSVKTSERERLLIQGTLAQAYDEPAALAIAESLAVRFPAELDGPYLLGLAHVRRGRFDDAVPQFRRVIELDSISLRGTVGRCRACDGLHQLISAYHALDSLPRAEALAREWTRLDPGSSRAWAILATMLFAQGKHDAAVDARRTATANGPFDAYDAVFPAATRVRAGDFAAADRMTRSLLRDAADHATADAARWLLIISLRYQGRWSEALELLSEIPSLHSVEKRLRGSGRAFASVEALVHLEAGRAARAAAIWDSLAQSFPPGQSERMRLRGALFLHTLAASALALSGDTARLAATVDSVADIASRTSIGLEPYLLAHARGLLASARGDTAQAIAAFRQAIYAPATGFTRSNRDLAELLISSGRAAEAIPVLQAALHGTLETMNLYLTHTELHELLGQAYTAIGSNDTAAVHFRYVAAAFAQADPQARVRLQRAMQAIDLAGR